MIKTKLSDYETTQITVEIDDKPVDLIIRSLASREFNTARSEYAAMAKHAEENDIPLIEPVEVDHGLGIVTKEDKQSEFALKAMAILLSSLVVGWKRDEDLREVIFDNPEFGQLIDRTASELAREFASKKKI